MFTRKSLGWFEFTVAFLNNTKKIVDLHPQRFEHEGFCGNLLTFIKRIFKILSTERNEEIISRHNKIENFYFLTVQEFK